MNTLPPPGPPAFTNCTYTSLVTGHKRACFKGQNRPLVTGNDQTVMSDVTVVQPTPVRSYIKFCYLSFYKQHELHRNLLVTVTRTLYSLRGLNNKNDVQKFRRLYIHTYKPKPAGCFLTKWNFFSIFLEVGLLSSIGPGYSFRS